MRKIVLVEGDHTQAEWVSKNLRNQYDVDVLSTEREFRKRFSILEGENLPDLVISELILRWKNPEDAEVPPKSVIDEGPRSVGFRCFEYLRAREREQIIEPIAVIFYSFFLQVKWQI